MRARGSIFLHVLVFVFFLLDIHTMPIQPWHPKFLNFTNVFEVFCQSVKNISVTTFKIEYMCTVHWCTHLNSNQFQFISGEKIFTNWLWNYMKIRIIYHSHLKKKNERTNEKKKTTTTLYSLIFLHHLHAFIIFSTQSLFTRCNWNGSCFLQINGKFLQGWCRCTKEIYQKGKTFKEII